MARECEILERVLRFGRYKREPTRQEVGTGNPMRASECYLLPVEGNGERYRDGATRPLPQGVAQSSSSVIIRKKPADWVKPE